MAKQTIGEFLATLRKANGYTQQEVADRLGISNRTLSGWECNNVLPDILLLPALAELYGVTVDEILAGERKEKTEVELTDKSEKRILKSKIARFSMQSWILLGIIIAGIALTATCAFIEVTKLSWVGFPWWRVLLVLGPIAVVICLSILLAFWKGAELTVDDTSSDYELYCIILRKKLTNIFYALAITSVFATIALVVALLVVVANSSAFDVDTFIVEAIALCISFGVCAAVFTVVAWLIFKHALTKFGGEAACKSIRKDRNYFWTVGFWGSIPLVLAIILAIVLGCVQITDETVVYENKSVDEFVEYMESIATPSGYRHLPLSDIAKTAKYGEEFDLGDGYFAVYHRYSFTVYNEMLDWHVDGDIGIDNVTFSIEVPRIYTYDSDDSFSFFNARYYWLHSGETGNPFHFWFTGSDVATIPNSPTRVGDRFIKYDYYSATRVGDALAYVHKIVYDYSPIGYAVAFPVIAVDLIVCAGLCVWKRNKFAVKL